MLAESWKPVKELWLHHHYLISDIGRVISLRSSKIVKSTKTPKGYMSICLFVGDRHTTRFIHRLVAEAFLPKRTNNDLAIFVNHKDGNKKNNRVSNLEWVDAREQMKHAIDYGLLRTGEDSPRSKLTEDQVSEIRLRREMGETIKSISKDYPISSTQVFNIVKYKNWNSERFLPRPIEELQ